MDTNNLNNIHGIVINELKYKNTSKIITVFTYELGLIKILCQGAYRKNSPLSSITNKYGYSIYNLNKGKSFYYIVDGVPEVNNFFLTKSLELLTVSALITELLEATLQEEQPESDIYRLLEEFLRLLKQDNSALKPALIAFLLKFSSFMGFRPNLKGCIKCGSKNSEMYTITASFGGATCSACGIFNKYNSVTREELIYLGRLLYLPMKDNIESIGNSIRVDYKKLTKISLDYLIINMDLQKLNIIKWLDKAKLI